MAELSDLSPEQQEVVSHWGQGMAVLAGAGSGKTTTLVIKCVELLKLNPEARFAAVSFTERSASDLRLKLTQRLSALSLPAQGQGGVLSRHWVMTIHGLCATIIREFPREAGFDGEETMLSEGEAALLWERATDVIWIEDDLPPEVGAGVERLLTRESRPSVLSLLARVRELFSFGVLAFLDASQDPHERDLGAVGRYVLDRYDRLKRRRGALDFNDLERGADRALEIASVREALQKRFDLVLVDEFQDTNPLQARIILRFVRPDASNLCVVGDPKQSIYRFRDADVTVFEDFCSQLPVNKRLTWNFRSRPGIIEYANVVCEKAFEASDMRFDALVPMREVRPDLDPVVRLDVRSPLDLARWVQSENARGVPLHEMALLMRRIRGNEKWLQALTSLGVPIAIGSGGLFWSDPRVRELGAFLKWWDNPGNALSAAVFLRSPWMGIPDVEIDAWVKRDPTFVRPFFESSHPVAQALKSLRGRIVRPGELLMALLVPGEAGEAIERELGAQLLGLWHRVEDLSWRGLDFHAVVSDVNLGIEQERRDRDVPPPRNQGQLSVLTLHGSKGLEFPHVILIDFGKKTRSSDTPLLFWDRERGAFLGRRTEDGEREKKNADEQTWRESEKSKNLAESKRLFYVALTRAQERLVLVCPELAETAAVDPEAVYGDDYWRGWIESAEGQRGIKTAQLPEVRSSVLIPQVAPLPSSPVSRLAPQLVRRPRHSVTEWNLLSRCERAYDWTYVRPMPLLEGIEEPGLFTGSKLASREEDELSQRELGTAVHSCLERGDFDGLKALESRVGSQRFMADPLISWAMSSEWMAPQAPGRDVFAELAFEVPFEKEVLVGSIDRVVVKDDIYTIVDFKVTEKPKSVEALLESYQTQMELYASGLRKLEGASLLQQGRVQPIQVEAFLVNISSRTIQVVPVPLDQVSPARAPIDALPRLASEIVAGRAGRPRPGPLCRYCDFKSKCPESRASGAG